MEFEKPDLPIPEKSTKKRRKKSAEGADSLERPKKGPKERGQEPKKESTNNLPVDEIIADLLSQEKPHPEAGEKRSKKKKKKKHGELAEPEPSEVVEVDLERHEAEDDDDEEADKPAEEVIVGDYQVDEFVVVPLEKSHEKVVPLRLPEISDEQPKSESPRPEAEHEWSFAEAVEQVDEKLAAEDAGVTLPEYAEIDRSEAPAENPEPKVAEVIQEAPKQPEAGQELPALKSPEEIMAVVAQAYELDQNGEGGGQLVPEARVETEQVVQKTVIEKAGSAKPEESTKVFKKLTSVESFAHQKLKRIKNLTEKSVEQTSYPNRRYQRLEQIYNDQLLFEDRRLDDERKRRTYERLQVSHAERSGKVSFAAEAPGIDEQLILPSNHRLERSAWHSIEVDKKTGRAVENSAINYGEEFHREKQQETLAEEPQEVAVASGQLAVGTASGGVQRQIAASSSAISSLADKTKQAYNKLESTIPLRNYRPNSVGDLALWVALFTVITAIILVS